MGAASLIIKATRYCNLRCAYCHDWRSGPNQKMPFPVMARMIAAALQDPTHNAVDFIWHGGETTTLPISFYEKAMLVQARFRRPGQVVRNNIQTNATRLNEEWVRFFRANRFYVGVSLDGPPELHNVYRRYASGRESFGDVVRGIRLLQEFGINHGLLMVVDQGALDLGADRIFDFFLSLGIKKYGLLSANPTNEPDAQPGTPIEHYSDPQRMNAFYMRIFDRWLEQGDPEIDIRELTAILQRLVGAKVDLCTFGGGCLGKYYMVEPNGDVAHCELFVGDPAYTLGNIMRDDFATIRRSARLRELQAGYNRSIGQMNVCPNFRVCNGWCPHERYLSVRHNPNHRDSCCGLSELIDYMRSRLAAKGMIPMADPVPA